MSKFNFGRLVSVPKGEQFDWLQDQIAKQEIVIAAKRKINPMVELHGPGPANTVCKTCQHLTWNQCSKRYYKCELRLITRGPATDHKVRWPACSKYTPCS